MKDLRYVYCSAVVDAPVLPRRPHQSVTPIPFVVVPYLVSRDQSRVTSVQLAHGNPLCH